MNDVPQPKPAAAALAARTPNLPMTLTICKYATGDDAVFGIDCFFAFAGSFLLNPPDPRIDLFKRRAVANGSVTQQTIELAHGSVYGTQSTFVLGTVTEGFAISFDRTALPGSGMLRAGVTLTVTHEGKLNACVSGNAAAVAMIANLQGEAGRLLTVQRWPIIRFIPVVGGRRNEVTFEAAAVDFAGAFQYAYDEATFTESKRRHG